MHKVIRKEHLNPEMCLVEIEAGDIAKVAKAGQFVVLRIDEQGERFPLTLYDWDARKGTITLVCQMVGVSTKKLCALNVGDALLDIAGPLGHATGTENIGKVICIGGGVGTAEAYPIAKAMKEAGNEVTAIIGFRNKDLVICEEELENFCDGIHVTTDDGSYKKKGFVTDVLKELLEKDKYDMVFAIGPVPMMKAVADVTRPKKVKTLVSLNSIMVDATGMCGCCRIQYAGETKFACVDGPEFDAHLVDFEDLTHRQGRYEAKEKHADDHYCRIRDKK